MSVKFYDNTKYIEIDCHFRDFNPMLRNVTIYIYLQNDYRHSYFRFLIFDFILFSKRFN